MAQFVSQTGFQFPIPEGKFFRTDDPDNIYRRTAAGIEAYAVKQGQNKNLFMPGFTEQQYQALPQFSSGIVTDLARAMGQGTIRVTGQLTPDLISQFGQVTPLGGVSQQALDPATAALAKAGGAGIGGFQAGGQAGLAAGAALSQTPQAFQNRLTALTEEKDRLRQLLSTPSAPITGSLLAPALAPTIKQPTPTPIPSPLAIAQAAQATQAMAQQQAQPVSPLGGLTASIEKLQRRILSPEVIQAEAEEKAGVPQLRKTQTELNAQLQMLVAEATAGITQLERQPGVTMPIIERQKQELLKDNTIKTLQISAMLQATQGNLVVAQDQVEKAVNLEFANAKDQLATLRQNIINNYDNFTPVQQRQAELTLKSLNAEDAFVKQQEEAKTANLALGMQLIDKVPYEIVDRIIKSGSQEAGLALAAPYLQAQEEEKILQTNFDADTGTYTQLVQKPDGKILARNIPVPGLTPSGKKTFDDYAKVLDIEFKIQNQLKDTERGKDFYSIETSYNTMVSAIGDRNFDAIAQDASRISNIFQNYALMVNSQTARVNPATVNVFGTVSNLVGIAENELAKAINDRNVPPGKIRKVVEAADKLYADKVRGWNTFVQQFQARLPDREGIPEGVPKGRDVGTFATTPVAPAFATTETFTNLPDFIVQQNLIPTQRSPLTATLLPGAPGAVPMKQTTPATFLGDNIFSGFIQ